MIFASRHRTGLPFAATSLFAALVASLVAFDASALLSDNAKTMILAGRASGEPQAAAIEQSPAWLAAVQSVSVMKNWESPTSFLSSASVANIRSFAVTAFPEAFVNTHRLLYLFGGADFPFAYVLFPEMDDLVMVGLERVGSLPNVEALAAQGTLRPKMERIGNAVRNLAANTYFITVNMARDLDEFGISTLLSVGAAAMGHQIVAVEPVALDAYGVVTTAAPGAPGVRIRYIRKDGREGKIVYLQRDLSDGSLAQQPALTAFLKNENFDSAFYKAASFASHDVAHFSRINTLVASNVRYLIQSDDGLPFSALDQKRWDLHFFGLYARPGPIFGRGEEADYLQAFATSICDSHDRQAASDMDRIWARGDLCQRYAPTPRYPSVRWMGYVPFRFGYGPFIGTPMPPELKPKVSNIIYGVAR